MSHMHKFYVKTDFFFGKLTSLPDRNWLHNKQSEDICCRHMYHAWILLAYEIGCRCQRRSRSIIRMICTTRVWFEPSANTSPQTDIYSILYIMNVYPNVYEFAQIKFIHIYGEMEMENCLASFRTLVWELEGISFAASFEYFVLKNFATRILNIKRRFFLLASLATTTTAQ